jgi:BolA protein
LKDFEAKMVGFENRIAEYKEVFEKRKRKMPPFADQKTIIEDTPMENMVRQKLTAAFDPLILDVIDDSAKHAGHAGVRHDKASPQGTHFRVRIVAAAFDNVSKIDRHRLVHDCLKTELDTHVHALSLTLLSPEESGSQ